MKCIRSNLFLSLHDLLRFLGSYYLASYFCSAWQTDVSNFNAYTSLSKPCGTSFSLHCLMLFVNFSKCLSTLTISLKLIARKKNQRNYMLKIFFSNYTFLGTNRYIMCVICLMSDTILGLAACLMASIRIINPIKLPRVIFNCNV